MSTSKNTITENQKVENANKINDLNAKMAEFLAQRDAKQQQLNEVIEAKRNERKSTAKYLGKQDFLRWQILLAGEEGIKLHQLIDKAKTYVNRDGKVDPVSTVTVRHNWGHKTDLVLRGEYQLTKSNIENEDEKGDVLHIYYDVKKVADKVKPNQTENLISVVPFSVDILKQYLFDNGLSEYMQEAEVDEAETVEVETVEVETPKPSNKARNKARNSSKK